MKIGVIGLGRMGRVHLRNYCEMQDVEVVGAVDPNEEVLAEVSRQFQVPVHTDLAALLAKGPDAVSICVPTVLHHHVGMAVLGRGVPALIEKPLAASVAEGEALVALARSRNLPLMVGHVERFNPAVRQLKQLIGDDVVAIEIERVGPYPARIQDVGVIKDLGPHDIDLVRHLTGADFEEVHAVFSASLGRHEDSAFTTARMANGALASITTSWITPYRSRRIRVVCKSKCLEADLITQKVMEYGQFSAQDKSYSVREWPVVSREPIKEEISQFLLALREGLPMPISGEDGLAVLRIIEWVMASGC